MSRWSFSYGCGGIHLAESGWCLARGPFPTFCARGLGELVGSVALSKQDLSSDRPSFCQCPLLAFQVCFAMEKPLTEVLMFEALHLELAEQCASLFQTALSVQMTVYCVEHDMSKLLQLSLQSSSSKEWQMEHDWLDFCNLMERWLSAMPKRKRSVRSDTVLAQEKGFSFAGRPASRCMLHAMQVCLETFGEASQQALNQISDIMGRDFLANEYTKLMALCSACRRWSLEDSLPATRLLTFVLRQLQMSLAVSASDGRTGAVRHDLEIKVCSVPWRCHF